MKLHSLIVSLLGLAWILQAPGSMAQVDAIVPMPLLGEWRGWGRQDTGTSWSIVVTLSGERAEIAYPSLQCRGVLELLSGEKSAARFREHLTSGFERCIDRGDVELRIGTDDRVEYRWWYPDGREGAWGTLDSVP